VLDAVCAEGYDRSFEELDPVAAVPAAVPGCADIRLDPLFDQVVLPAGVHLDFGGIGKGRAADLVAKDLVLAGARSGVVNLGGDLRLAGPPLDEALVVTIEDPLRPGGTAAVVALRSGALATSSVARRAWTVQGEARHHLIDPSTGRSADSGVAAVTVLAGDALRAEVLAKSALIAGPDDGLDLLEAAGAPGLLVTADGDRVWAAGFEEHLA
jgi:thiamine biosynthesis lipoprotein